MVYYGGKAKMTKEISSKMYQFIMEQNRNTPYHRLLDMNISEVYYGYCQAELTVQKKHMNPMDVTHGGVGFSILDVVMGTAVTTTGVKSTTVEMNINYLRPSFIDEHLIARGWVIKEGSSLIIAEGKIYKGEKEVAVARETMKSLGEIEI